MALDEKFVGIAFFQCGVKLLSRAFGGGVDFFNDTKNNVVQKNRSCMVLDWYASVFYLDLVYQLGDPLMPWQEQKFKHGLAFFLLHRMFGVGMKVVISAHSKELLYCAGFIERTACYLSGYFNNSKLTRI